MILAVFTLLDKRIWVAGHQGMVGSALVRALPPASVITVPRSELDLRDQAATRAFITREKPHAIIIAAATVGGIGDNKARPADFLYDNLMIEANIIQAAHEAGVEKLLLLGSSCIYPRNAAQPISEDALLTGALEPTNEAYAVAKIAGIKLCQAYQQQYKSRFISAMPCNLYGAGDRFDLQRSHVIPALMIKMHRAKQENLSVLELWGTGTPLREFLHVDDLARALIIMLERYEGRTPLNIGSGTEITIEALAAQMAQVVGYQGAITFNPAYPDGTPRKILDSGMIRALGWQPAIGLADGLRDTYEWFCRYPQAHRRAA